MSCQRLASKRRGVCAGDLDKRIVLQNRTLNPPVFGDPDFTESFTAANTRWAGVETVAGKTFFDSVNQVDQTITHYWYIRYDATVTSQTWILYDSRRFDILATEDLDERHEFMRLICVDKGVSQV
jgi:SPP1 family predicted phage head-tail adaptor